ncbi:MAG: hypothetical protein IT162_12360 [Bryobacterales bacterium]|nr:hypothetical protein [Bryobacterales bacterium]
MKARTKQHSYPRTAAAAAPWLLLLAAGAAVAAAQPTLYLRSGAPPLVELATCTNATPVVCTSKAPHGLAPGDAVVISNAVGNTAVNGSHKVLATASPTVFSLASLETGAPVSGNGAWSTGGGPLAAGPSRKLAGKAQPFTVGDHPRLLLDGPGGQFTRRLRCGVDNGCLRSITVEGGVATATLTGGGHGLQPGSRVGIWGAPAAAKLNGTQTVSETAAESFRFPAPEGAPDGVYEQRLLAVSEYAFAGNPAWEAMMRSVTLFAESYRQLNANPTMEKFAMAALLWYTDREATWLLEIARWGVQHAENSFYGSGVCLQNQAFCGGRTGTDYIRFNSFNAALTYSLLASAGELTQEDRDLFAEKMLNDIDTNCTLPPLRSGAGRLLATRSETVVRGEGTAFRSELAPGDVLYIPEFGNDDHAHRVEEVLSDTELRLSRFSGYTYQGAFRHSRSWQKGDCGAAFLMKHHTASVVGDPAQYPTRGASEASHYGNLSMTAFWSYFHLGLALAEYPAGRRLAETSWLYGYDQILGYAISSWTGLTQAGSVYHWYRSPWMAADLVFTTKYALSGFPDLLGASPDWLAGVLPLSYYSYMPFGNYTAGTAFGPLFGEGSLTVSPYWLSYQARVLRLFENTPQGFAWRWWLKNRYGYTASTIADNQGQGALSYYLGVNPQLDATDNTQLPGQYLLNRNGWEACAELGMAQCGSAERKYAVAVSRGGWTSADDSQLQIYGGTYETDHFENQAGDYRIVKGVAGNTTPCLLGGDHPQCTTANVGLDKSSLLEVGEGYARRAGAETPISDISRWAGERPAGDPASRYTYAMVDLTGVFKESYAVERAHRHFIHFKQPGAPEEIVVVYDDVATGRGQRIRAYTHYSQNGQPNEGRTSCPGSESCSTSQIASGRVLSQSTAHTLVSQYLSPRPATRVRLFADKPDGTYTGGLGHSFRVTYCATTNDTTCALDGRAMEALIVHRVVAGTADTALNATLLTPGDAWTGVQTDSTVALLTRGGQLATELPAVRTSHPGTARYLVAGLEPGLYDVTADGVTIAAAQVVAAGDTTLYFEGAAALYAVRPASGEGMPADAAAAARRCAVTLAADPLTPAAAEVEASVRYYLDGGCAAARTAAAGSMRVRSAAARPVAAAAAVSTQPGRTVLLTHRARRGAEEVLVEWDTRPPGSEPWANRQQAPCRAGCTVAVTLPAAGPVYVRSTYRSGSGATVAATRTRRIAVR